MPKQFNTHNPPSIEMDQQVYKLMTSAGDKKPPKPVSIIIPCCGQLEYTRLCIQSIMRNSRIPFELLIIDIASLDGSREYLAGVEAAARVPVNTIRISNDLEFQNACIETLSRARGEFIIWLNNDTIVTSDWLQQLVGLASGNDSIGMTGPMSNCAPQHQLVEIPYRIGQTSASCTEKSHYFDRSARDLNIVDEFALNWREKHKGQWFRTDRLAGFCLLIKRKILRKINLFDPNSDQGVFDADSLGRQVKKAGFDLACCKDLFIHHFGSRLSR